MTQKNVKRFLFLLLVFSAVFMLSASSLGAARNVMAAREVNVIITEIMYNPSSNETNWEWIEIYNPDVAAVDLAGWVVDDINGLAHTSANIASGVPQFFSAIPSRLRPLRKRGGQAST
jgi:hypothetical protein